MLRKHSTPSSFSAMLLASVVLAVSAINPASVRSEDAPAPSAPGVPPRANMANTTVAKLADDFLHFSIVGEPEKAADSGQAILDMHAEPKAVLEAFEQVADGRNVQTILERNQRQPQLKNVSIALSQLLEAGYRNVARDPARIRADIDRLAISPRAYQNAREHLLAAGEFAVPIYIQYLQDNNKKNLQPYIVRVMTEIGKPLLPALVQELQTPDDGLKLTIITELGNIGYALAVPYLKVIAQDDKALAEVRSAAQSALTKINERTDLGKGNAAESFQVLAQNYFDGRPSVAPQNPAEATNPMWYYNKETNNVERYIDKSQKDVPEAQQANVPTPIWNEVQAMRAAEMALRLEPKMPAAISLWVAANLRREIHLAAGMTDPTRPEGGPDGMFYALSAGPMYLNPALNAAINDRDSALILKLVSALEATSGAQGTVVSAKDAGNPLVRALGYPDRAVRFNAAFALGRADPAKDYPGSYRVVPILCEAVSQSNALHVILVDGNESSRAKFNSLLTSMNYVVHEGPNLTSAMSDAGNTAAFDAVIVPGIEALHVAELAATDYRLSATPVVVVSTDPDRVDALQAEVSHIGPLYRAAPGNMDGPTLQSLIADIKKVVAVTPIDADMASQLALTSISVLDTLSINRQSIYKVNDAVPTLSEALGKHLDVATASASVLGKLNSLPAQKAISEHIFADGIDPKLKKALLDALANSAKVQGNHVDPAIVDKLIDLVIKDGDADLRAAGAKALGAMNVQSGQASQLILQQAK